MAITAEFSFQLQELCSFCYKENRYKIFKDDRCIHCHQSNRNPVYVNPKNHEQFVRDFRNCGSLAKGSSVDECKHERVTNKYNHATTFCTYAISDFEYFIWNWMKTYKKFKISELFKTYISPYVYTPRIQTCLLNRNVDIVPKEHQERINPVPQTCDENERIQLEEKRKIYFCWFCLKNVTSEHDVAVHSSGADHSSYYEADKKRRWYFKMPKTNPVRICKVAKCLCLAPHHDDEYREMNARIKFRYFNFKNFDLEKKKLNPWPNDIGFKMPLFPNNIECYSKPLRITVELNLGKWNIGYICFRGEVSRPYYTLYDSKTNQKGQILKFDICETNNNCDTFCFDIEFFPLCSATYLQKIEFSFLFNGNEYCCQKLIRVDVGSTKHLEQFINIWRQFHLVLKRSQNENIIKYLKTFDMDFKDFEYEYIIPFSITNPTGNSILSENLLRRVFRVVSNLNWLDSRVEPWNYVDWMKDMMVHEELSQQLLLSELIFIGDLHITNSYTKEKFIPSKPGQLYGTLVYQNDPRNSIARDFVVKNIIRAFVLFPGFNNKLSLHECDIVDLFHYEVESRSIKEVAICFPEVAVNSLKLKHNMILHRVIVLFRYNRLLIDRRHNTLERMPHYDRLAYAPLCCPYFTHLPYGEHESAVSFKPMLALNAEQLRLPRLVLRHLKSDETALPFILNGAFGTGKTSVIAETVRTVLVYGEKCSKILICTRSYSAGKVYLNMFQRCLSDKCLNKIKLIMPQYRMSKPEREYNTFVVYNDFFTHEIFKINRVFITSLDNVTYAMSEIVNYYNEENPMFDYLFVDEAAQVLEIDAISVYQFGGKRSKFIFAGDVFQLRPEYFNKNLKKFSLPIVCRLHKMYDKCPDYEICLKQVYRSHPLLVKYLSEAIYRDCGLTSSMIPTFPYLKPIKFIDSNDDGNNREEFDDIYCSFKNDVEAKMIIMAIETIMKCNYFKEENILICSPFYTQVKVIRYKLKKRGIVRITVEQPSNIQGKEFDAVFISTVLTINNELKYPIHHSTFHSDKTLINLAISRAKHYVEVVGDKKCLLKLKCVDQWEKFIKFSV